MLAHEGDLRVMAFLGVLLLMAGLEALRPRRDTPRQRGLRWPSNLGIVVIDTVLVRLLIPLGAVGVAVWAERSAFGLLHLLNAPFWPAAVIAFLALDSLIYWQHRLFHLIPFFWRLHRMHHSDVEFDTTTGIRFHPVEILISMLIKMGAVALLGAPAVAVIAFEIALNATSLFNHANWRLPAGVDRWLRWIVVTPDMHRVHHSTWRREHDTNFGFNLPWWDHLFGSYTDQPQEGHAQMRIGLNEFREIPEQRLGALLWQPLRPLGRHD
jgi:sterol desaturase/sphingolipid hydroxylase (fatty acid hydroxylase superfamily)